MRPNGKGGSNNSVARVKTEAGGTRLVVADCQNDRVVIAGVVQTSTAVSAAVLPAHGHQLQFAGGDAAGRVDAGDDVDAAVGAVDQRPGAVHVPRDGRTRVRFAVHHNDGPGPDALVFRYRLDYLHRNCSGTQPVVWLLTIGALVAVW